MKGFGWQLCLSQLSGGKIKYRKERESRKVGSPCADSLYSFDILLPMSQIKFQLKLLGTSTKGLSELEPNLSISDLFKLDIALLWINPVRSIAQATLFTNQKYIKNNTKMLLDP